MSAIGCGFERIAGDWGTSVSSTLGASSSERDGSPMRGRHFAAPEVPDLLVDDLPALFRQVW